MWRCQNADLGDMRRFATTARSALLLLCLVVMSLAVPVAPAGAIGSASGFVHDASGQPIAGAVVRVASAGVETTTDPSGAFDLAVAAGRYDVTVDVSDWGLRAQMKAAPLGDGVPIDIVVVKPTVTLSGTVIDGAGRPLPGATV